MIRLSIVAILAMTGCDRQPSRVAWISVEKPPIKVIYIDKQGELDPVITDRVFSIVGHTPYRNLKLNETTSVSLEANSHQSDVESDTDSTSISTTRSP